MSPSKLTKYYACHAKWPTEDQACCQCGRGIASTGRRRASRSSESRPDVSDFSGDGTHSTKCRNYSLSGPLDDRRCHGRPEFLFKRRAQFEYQRRCAKRKDADGIVGEDESNIWQKFAENSWNVISNARPIRVGSDHDPTMNPSVRNPPRDRGYFSCSGRAFCIRKKQHLALRLSFQISPSTAPATKSDTWPSPSTVPATKSDTWASPSIAPVTKSDTWASPSIAPATKSDTWAASPITKRFDYLTLLLLSDSIAGLYYYWAILLFDSTMTERFYYLTLLLLSDSIAGLYYYWAILLLDSTITKRIYYLTLLLLSGSITWLYQYWAILLLDSTILLLDSTITERFYYLTLLLLLFYCWTLLLLSDSIAGFYQLLLSDSIAGLYYY